MPDTPLIAAIRERAADALPFTGIPEIEDCAHDRRALLAYLDALTAAAEGLTTARDVLMDPPTFDQRALALNEIDAVLTILRGEQ